MAGQEFRPMIHLVAGAPIIASLAGFRITVCELNGVALATTVIVCRSAALSGLAKNF